METLKAFVRRRRNEMGLSQAAFAKLAGVEAHTVWQIEKGATKSPKSGTVQGLARALAISPEQVVLMLRDENMQAADDHELLRDGETKLLVALDPIGRDFVARYKASGMSLKDFNEKFGGANYPQTEFDNNVGRIPANPLPIPEWSAEIACGHWIDCSTAALDPDTQMAIIRAGRFRVRVMGDSMLPKYKPGACVQFRIVRMDEESLQIGAHYYVQNSDGQCTLKVLKAIEEDEYVLAPTNRKYKPLRIAKQMVARWAIVETIVVAPWEE